LYNAIIAHQAVVSIDPNIQYVLYVQVSVFVGGTGAGDVAKEIATVDGVTEVLFNNSATYDHAIAENVSKGLAELQASKSFTHILVSDCLPFFSTSNQYIPRLFPVVGSHRLIAQLLNCAVAES
jgi:hypothetical protein